MSPLHPIAKWAPVPQNAHRGVNAPPVAAPLGDVAVLRKRSGCAGEVAGRMERNQRPWRSVCGREGACLLLLWEHLATCSPQPGLGEEVMAKQVLHCLEEGLGCMG